MPLQQFVSKLSPRGWIAVGGAAAVSIVFLVLVFQMASAPSYATVLTGLDPAQTGKITSTLDTKGITYQIQNNGTALAVQSDKTAQARIALASAGLLTGSGSDPLQSVVNSPLGASNFQQQIAYQRALQQELTQTIDQVQGVSGSQVTLAIPSQTSTFLNSTNTPASASVLISDNGGLDPSSVRGIAQLVSSSVANLSLDKVTITDSRGQLLWPTSGASGGGAGGSMTSQQSANAAYAQQKAAEIDAMLTQALGPGKALVQINADLNTDATTTDQVGYAKGIAAQTQTQTETLTGAGAPAAAGAAGTAGTLTGATTGNANSNYKNVQATTSFDVPKTITHSQVTPGAIRSQSISLTVDSSIPKSQMTAIKAAVQGAAGYNPTRGDKFYFGTMAFAKPSVTAASAPTQMLSYVKYVVVGLGAILFLFFVTRMLRRREGETVTGEPTWLRELETRRPLSSLPHGDMAPLSDDPTQVIPLQAPVNVPRRQVEDLVERDADRVAQQLRAWMSED